MKPFVVVLGISILNGCNSIEEFNTGTYTSYRPNLIEKILSPFQNTSYSIGTEININKDSTFILTSCANIMAGKWKLQDDTLFLFVEKNRWQNDSLNTHGYNGNWPSIPEKPLFYRYKDNKLFAKGKLLNGNTSIRRLKYNVP